MTRCEESDWAEERDESSIVSAALHLSGRDLDLADCTRAIGLQPTGTWTQTREALRAEQSLSTESWWVGVEGMRADDTAPVIDAALLIIWDHRAQIEGLVAARSLSCEFLVTVRVVFNKPLFGVSPGAMASLAEIRCPLRFVVRGE